MSTAVATTVKKTTRARKTSVSADLIPAVKTDSLAKSFKAYEESFVNLLNSITSSKEEFSSLQKEIADVKELWNKEQKDHEVLIQEINREGEITRRREKETYDYETNLNRKKEEDEFFEKKLGWEKELQSQKDVIAKEKQELEMLRKQVAGFEAEKEKAAEEATAALRKDMQGTFAAEKNLREQEVKSEKELLTFKIVNLTQENARQSNEIVAFKKALEEATSQLKDVAVKVIESSSNKTPTPASQE